MFQEDFSCSQSRQLGDAIQHTQTSTGDIKPPPSALNSVSVNGITIIKRTLSEEPQPSANGPLPSISPRPVSPAVSPTASFMKPGVPYRQGRGGKRIKLDRELICSILQNQNTFLKKIAESSTERNLVLRELVQEIKTVHENIHIVNEQYRRDQSLWQKKQKEYQDAILKLQKQQDIEEKQHEIQIMTLMQEHNREVKKLQKQVIDLQQKLLEAHIAGKNIFNI